MKAQDIVLLRKKYVNLIFELAKKSFNIQQDFLLEEKNLRIYMEKDILLSEHADKISSRIDSLNQEMKELSKIAKFDKNALDELTQIQLSLKNQQKNNKTQRQEHYTFISKQYFEILVQTTMKVLGELEKDELFNKMRLAIKKTENRFIEYCKQWKSRESENYKKLGQQIELIYNFSSQLVQDIDACISTETTDAYTSDASISHISSLKNSRVAANCTTLAHYLENFKELYPQTLGFKAQSLTKINLKEDFNDLMEANSFGSMKASLKMKGKLNLAKKQVGIVNRLFHELLLVNNKHLEKIEDERIKMMKIAIGEYQLTQTTIKQWLESDKKSLFFIFSEYLDKHKFAEL